MGENAVRKLFAGFLRFAAILAIKKNATKENNKGGANADYVLSSDLQMFFRT